MATAKHPNEKHDPKKAANDIMLRAGISASLTLTPLS